jgi:hypothetical protein
MTLVNLFIITAFAFLLVIVGMAVGVLMGRREIRGSCGGLASGDEAKEGGSCALCSNPDAACREFASRQHSDSAEKSGCSAGEGQEAARENYQQCGPQDCDKAAMDACKNP